MARRARKRSESGFYHVMLRGINRQIIFESADDKYRLLSTLKRFIDAEKFAVYGYCLMDNHVHLLIQELEDDISGAIRRICSSYVLWYNKKYDRCGHLFQERFKSEPVENDNHFLMNLRYIHQNPIKAGLCEDLLDYKWTSYKEYIGKSIMIDTDLCLDLFSPDKDRAVELFMEHMTQSNDDSIPSFEDNIKMTDAQVIERLKEMGVSSVSELQKLERNKRDSLLKVLKKTRGISIRQVSRITGISKGIIERL